MELKMLEILTILGGAIFTGLFCYGIWLLIFEDWS